MKNTKIKRKYIAVVMLLSILLFFLLIILANHNRHKFWKGSLSSYSEVQSDSKLSMLSYMLPPEAKDIRYYIVPHAVAMYVDFTIDKADLKKWAMIKDWELEEIKYKRFLAPSPLNANKICIKKGLDYIETYSKKNDSTRGSTLKVLFDSNASRCYYRYIGSYQPDLVDKSQLKRIESFRIHKISDKNKTSSLQADQQSIPNKGDEK